ncbi:hypothetical protein X801_01928, partial [Opisthorchis viverrini]
MVDHCIASEQGTVSIQSPIPNSQPLAQAEENHSKTEYAHSTSGRTQFIEIMRVNDAGFKSPMSSSLVLKKPVIPNGELTSSGVYGQTRSFSSSLYPPQCGFYNKTVENQSHIKFPQNRFSAGTCAKERSPNGQKDSSAKVSQIPRLVNSTKAPNARQNVNSGIYRNTRPSPPSNPPSDSSTGQRKVNSGPRILSVNGATTSYRDRQHHSQQIQTNTQRFNFQNTVPNPVERNQSPITVTKEFLIVNGQMSQEENDRSLVQEEQDDKTINSDMSDFDEEKYPEEPMIMNSFLVDPIHLNEISTKRTSHNALVGEEADTYQDRAKRCVGKRKNKPVLAAVRAYAEKCNNRQKIKTHHQSANVSSPLSHHPSNAQSNQMFLDHTRHRGRYAEQYQSTPNIELTGRVGPQNPVVITRPRRVPLLDGRGQYPTSKADFRSSVSALSYLVQDANRHIGISQVPKNIILRLRTISHSDCIAKSATGDQNLRIPRSWQVQQEREKLPPDRRHAVGFVLLLMGIRYNEQGELSQGGLEHRLREALELVSPTQRNMNGTAPVGGAGDCARLKAENIRLSSEMENCNSHRLLKDHRMTQSCYQGGGSSETDAYLQSSSRPEPTPQLNGQCELQMTTSCISIEDSSDTEQTRGELDNQPSDSLPSTATILRRLARTLAVRIAFKQQHLADAQQKVARNETEEKWLRNKLNELFNPSDRFSFSSSTLTRTGDMVPMTDFEDSTATQVITRFDRWHKNMVSVVQLLCQLARRLACVDARILSLQQNGFKRDSNDITQDSQCSLEFLNRQKVELEFKIKEAQSLRAGLENCRLRLLESIPPGLKVEDPSPELVHGYESTDSAIGMNEHENESDQNRATLQSDQTTKPTKHIPVFLRDRISVHLLHTLQWLVTYH